MSRFVEILEEHEREITVESFQAMLREMVEKLEAEEGHIEMSFPYFIEKKAPVSGVKSLLDYEVTFLGEYRKRNGSFTMKVVVPVTSLCPCSKKYRSAARNQRSHVTVMARTHEFVWIEEIVDIVEKTGIERALRPAQASRREVRDRARVRQPEVRRGHGARRGRGAESR